MERPDFVSMPIEKVQQMLNQAHKLRMEIGVSTHTPSKRLKIMGDVVSVLKREIKVDLEGSNGVGQEWEEVKTPGAEVMDHLSKRRLLASIALLSREIAPSVFVGMHSYKERDYESFRLFFDKAWGGANIRWALMLAEAEREHTADSLASQAIEYSRATSGLNDELLSEVESYLQLMNDAKGFLGVLRQDLTGRKLVQASYGSLVSYHRANRHKNSASFGIYAPEYVLAGADVATYVYDEVFTRSANVVGY